MEEIKIKNPKQFKNIMNDKSVSEYNFVEPIIIKGNPNTDIVKPPKISVNELAITVNNLAIKVNDLYNLVVLGFKQVNERIDKDHELLINLEKRVSNLEEIVYEDHKVLIKTANKLDRVIKLNNLKY